MKPPSFLFSIIRSHMLVHVPFFGKEPVAESLDLTVPGVECHAADSCVSCELSSMRFTSIRFPPCSR